MFHSHQLLYIQLPVVFSNDEDTQVINIVLNVNHIISMLDDVNIVDGKEIIHTILQVVTGDEYYVPLAPSTILETINKNGEQPNDRWRFNPN